MFNAVHHITGLANTTPAHTQLCSQVPCTETAPPLRHNAQHSTLHYRTSTPTQHYSQVPSTGVPSQQHHCATMLNALSSRLRFSPPPLRFKAFFMPPPVNQDAAAKVTKSHQPYGTRHSTEPLRVSLPTMFEIQRTCHHTRQNKARNCVKLRCRNRQQIRQRVTTSRPLATSPLHQHNADSPLSFNRE
jgi:hypothetical protein